MRYSAIAFLGSAATRRYPQLTTMITIIIFILTLLIMKEKGKFHIEET